MGWWGLFARSPRTNDRKKIVGANSAITINISIRISAAPRHNNSKHVIHVYKAVTVGIRTVWWSLVTDGVVAVVYPIANNLIRGVPAHHRIRQRGAAPGTIDPAAIEAGGMVVRDRAACDRGGTLEAVDSTAVEGRVARKCAVPKRRVAVVVVVNSTTVVGGNIIFECTACDCGVADTVNSTTVVGGNIVCECTTCDCAAASALHPPAI